MTQREQRTKQVAIAQDTGRVQAFKRARWNTRYVRILRVVLPLTAVGLVGLYGINLSGNLLLSQISNDDQGKLQFESAEMSAEGFGMANPRYEGFNDDGSRFLVTAKRAITGLKVDGPIKLETIDGSLFGLDNTATRLIATRGTYDQKSGKLTLADGIVIETTDGMTARLASADVNAKSGAISSREAVEVQMPIATIAGRQFQANQKTRTVLFDRGVVAHLKPEQVSGASTRPPRDEAVTPAAQGFQIASNQPIRVTAKSLEVRDQENRAVFKTNVVAAQSTGTLAADQLTVRYAPQTETEQAAQTAAGNRKVEQLIAEQRVRLTQGTDTITAAKAIFLPEANTADFSGGVQLDSDGTAVTAATLFVDQAKSVARLEGNVKVTQGRNTLAGHRMTIDQTGGRMTLTAPPSGGLIATRFFREAPAGVAGAVRRSARPTPGQGQSPFSFQTDPAAPIDVAARKLDVQDKRKLAIYTGAVSAKQGIFSIKSDKLTARYSGSAGLSELAPGARRPASSAGTAAGGADLEELIADGGVTITSSPTQKAKGQRAVYNVAQQKLTLSGNVTVIDGRQILVGESLSIDMTTGLSSLNSGASATPVAEGGKKPGRMRAVFFPVDLQNARKQRKQGDTKPTDAGGWSSQTSASGASRTN